VQPRNTPLAQRQIQYAWARQPTTVKFFSQRTVNRKGCLAECLSVQKYLETAVANRNDITDETESRLNSWSS
jgi:succinate dehydrogenase/fumarate reductase flavoprotein subunit